jgi:hypothetical protein
MSSTQASFFDSLRSAVRDNPVAAALIGGGAAWLLVGNAGVKAAASSAAAAASPVVDAGTRNLRSAASGLRQTVAPPTAPEMDHEAPSGIGENSREARHAASDAISSAAETIRDRLDEGIGFARENLGKLNPGKESFTKAQSALAEMLERQPLAIGAIGLAIGAVFAGSFRTSDLESDWIGELSDDMKADLNERAGAVSQSLREASDSLKAELSDTGAEAVDRVKQAGMDAMGAARQKVSSSSL